MIRKGSLSLVGEKLTLPQWPDPDRLLKLENQDRVITDPSLKIIIHHLTTTAKIWELPDNYQEVTIAGPAEATRDQAVVLLRRYNPNLPIKATPEEIVDLYYQEAGREGLRWDIVFCQALLETGFFRFGGHGWYRPRTISAVWGPPVPRSRAPGSPPHGTGSGPMSST